MAPPGGAKGAVAVAAAAAPVLSDDTESEAETGFPVDMDDVREAENAVDEAESSDDGAGEGKARHRPRVPRAPCPCSLSRRCARSLTG